MTVRCKTKYNLFTDVEMEKCEGSKPSLDFRSLRNICDRLQTELSRKTPKNSHFLWLSRYLTMHVPCDLRTNAPTKCVCLTGSFSEDRFFGKKKLRRTRIVKTKQDNLCFPSCNYHIYGPQICCKRVDFEMLFLNSPDRDFTFCLHACRDNTVHF